MATIDNTTLLSALTALHASDVGLYGKITAIETANTGDRIASIGGNAIVGSVTSGATGTELVTDVQVDGTTIKINGTNALTADLALKKLGTATAGFAATYQLQVGTGADATAIGDVINIPKDQFLKSAAFGYSTVAGVPTDDSQWSETAGATAFPCLKFEFQTGESYAEAATVYVPVNDLVDVYTAGDGLALANNQFSVKVAGDYLEIVNGNVTTTAALDEALAGLGDDIADVAADVTNLKVQSITGDDVIQVAGTELSSGFTLTAKIAAGNDKYLTVDSTNGLAFNEELLETTLAALSSDIADAITAQSLGVAAGNGISITSETGVGGATVSTIAAKVKTDDPYLTVTADGLATQGIDDAIEAAGEDAVATAVEKAVGQIRAGDGLAETGVSLSPGITGASSGKTFEVLLDGTSDYLSVSSAGVKMDDAAVVEDIIDNINAYDDSFAAIAGTIADWNTSVGF